MGSSTGFGAWEQDRVQALLDKFALSRDTLEQVMASMCSDFKNGLSNKADEQHRSPIKMLPTYVRSIPDGSESGDFFALDLGGTNFRVLHVRIANQQAQMSHKTFPMEGKMSGSADNLFGYIAECLTAFVKEKLGPNTKRISSVGFTFSFPVLQKSLTSGDLIKWTKGFNVDGVEGHDIVKLLSDALHKKMELEVDQIVLLNDTTGVMISCAFEDHDVAIGLILGTGTNACYMEKLSNVPKWDGDFSEPKQVIINTEWGAFGDKGELNSVKTPYDIVVDSESLYPGEQIYEKMISGMYLGEIVRQALLDLIRQYVLFRGKVSNEIAEKNSFQTWYVSDISGGNAKRAAEIMSILGYPNATLRECLVVHEVCIAVSLRAARLAAAGLATIIRRIDQPALTVAIDGSVFKKHPLFRKFMQDALTEFVATTHVTLRLADDGSGRGAALVAAVAQRLAQGSSP